MYGYLLVTQNSLPMTALIAADYHSSVVEMMKFNKSQKKNYSCSVICLNCNFIFRCRLSMRTGIPLKKISSVNQVKDVGCIIDVDSFMDDTFLGSIKIYDSENNVQQKDFNSCLTIKYAEPLWLHFNPKPQIES